MEDLRTLGVAVLMLPTTRTESGVALRAIVAAAGAVITRGGVSRVFVTGGETAFALCRELDVSALMFRAEVEPGLTLSTAAIAGGSMLYAVKPGGFGDEDTWVRALRALRESNL